jgi:hypothetical protein
MQVAERDYTHSCRNQLETYGRVLEKEEDAVIFSEEVKQPKRN